jgi:ferredoxin
VRIITVKVDPSLCIAAACCVGILPNVFRLNEDSVAVVLSESPQASPFEGIVQIAPADMPKIEDAVESCPVRAISYTE